MKGQLIALDHLNGREAAALIEDGQLRDILIDADLPRPGAIYRAIADRPVKGQGGMFVITPDGSGFVRGLRKISPGQPLLVQVTGYAEEGKAIPLTTRLLFKSRHVIVTPEAPGINISRQIRDEDIRDALLSITHDALEQTCLPEGAGVILRSNCHPDDADALIEDIATMSSLAKNLLGDTDGPAELLLEGDGPHALAWREWPAPAQVDPEEESFERHGVLDALDALASARVDLPGGYSMIIEQTSALVAVDINTGNDTSPAAGLKANLAAMRDLPRQLRLRGLGGQIVVDLAPCAKKDRRQIESLLKSSLKREQTETIVAGWTTLGLLELQRKRDRIPLKALS